MNRWCGASSILNFNLAIFPFRRTLVVLILHYLLFHSLQRNLREKYPNLFLIQWKFNAAVWQHWEWGNIFVQYWLLILWNMRFFIWYNDYIHSKHLQNCTLKNVLDCSCFLVIIGWGRKWDRRCSAKMQYKIWTWHSFCFFSWGSNQASLNDQSQTNNKPAQCAYYWGKKYNSSWSFLSWRIHWTTFRKYENFALLTISLLQLLC